MAPEAVAFVWLKDGRRIAYQEMGCTQDTATRSLLVLHGAFSSRLFAMPGISRALLLEFGVRLVAIDRPGYGESDPNPSQTLENFTCDIVSVVDQLCMGPQIWLLGYSLGCIYCWAAARYIPHRLAGIALWAPPTNFEWKIFTREEVQAIKAGFSWRALRELYFESKRMPFAEFRQHVGAFCNRLLEIAHIPNAFLRTLSPSDINALRHPHILEFFLRDRLISLGGWTNGYGLAKDFQLLTSPWGFEAKELINHSYQGMIHIWQGDQDTAVPLLLQEIMERRLHFVTLHKLLSHGHFSGFYFNDCTHRSTMNALFAERRCHKARL